MQIQKAGKILLVYIEALVALVFLAAFGSMVIQQSYALMSGAASITLFNGSRFIHSLVSFLPGMSVAALLVVVLHIICHDYSFWEAVLPYIILCLLVWCAIVPLWARMFPTYAEIAVALPYVDPVIQQVCEVPDILEFLVGRLSMLQTVVFASVQHGIAGYLMVLPVGLSLSCVALLDRLFSWRLFNALVVSGAFLILFVSNSYLYDARFITTHEALQRLGYWLPVIANVVASVLFAVAFGLGSLLRHGNPNKEEPEE